VTAALIALALATAAGRQAIPPGREPLLLEMLAPPARRAGCECRGIQVERDRVVAKVECGGRLQALTLLPPGAEGAARRTEKFSLVAGGALPDALLDEVAESVRGLEARWTWIGRPAGPRIQVPLAAFKRPSALAALGAILAAAALGLLALARGARGRPGEERTAPGRPSWLELAAFPAAFAALALLTPDPPAHLDTARDLLTARDLAAGRPVLPAVPSSFEEVWHASLWIRALQLWLWTGLSLKSLHLAVLLGHAAAAAAVWSGLRPLTSGGLTLAAAAGSLWAGIAVTELPTLWNPSILPLPAAGLSWALLRLARGGGAGPGLLAAISLGACAQIHAVMLLLLPALLFAVAMASRRPAMALLASAGAFVGAWTAGALEVVAALMPRVPPGPATLAAMVSVGAGLALRRPFRALPEAMRAFALAFAGSISCAAALSVQAAWLGRAPEPRYLAPLSPIALVALALGARRIWDAARTRMGTAWRPILAFALGGLMLAAHGRPRREGGWTLFDARDLAARLSSDGWRAQDLVRHLRSPDAPRRLLGSILAFLPEPPAGAAPTVSRECDLLAVKVPLEAIPAPPREWEIAPLGARQAAVLRCLPSALAWREPKLCYAPASTPDKEACAPARFDFSTELLSHLAYPALVGGPGDAWPEGGRVHVRALVGTAAAARGARIVETFPAPPGWRVGRLEGALPGRAVALAPGGNEELVFTAELASDSDYAASAFPPDFVEREPSEAALDELLARWRAER
jgi:hypothetical protein